MIPDAGDIQQAFGFPGAVTVERRQGRVVMSYFADVDEAEVSRRAAAGIGPIVDRRLINALWEIPADLELPRGSLPDWVTARLARVSVAQVGTTVRRDVRPPVRLRGAAAVGPRLARLLDALGPLSAVCPTAAVLTRGWPAASDPALLDAQLFGVGVAVADHDGVHVVAPAQPVRADIGAYQWHVAELVYAELTRVG
jgi:hypothetical protein